MTRIRKIVLWVCGLAAVALVYNLDAIVGRWKFERMCKNEGGPRFYRSVEKDVGWQVGNDTYDYAGPFNFGHIAFVRFEDKKGKQSDVRSDGYIGPNRRKYSFSDVDETKPVRYSLRYGTKILADDRFSKSQRLVTDLKTGAVVASFTEFDYSWTKPERMLLSMPTAVGCWTMQKDIDKFHKGIYSTGNKK